jgi:hypothetical protein
LSPIVGFAWWPIPIVNTRSACWQLQEAKILVPQVDRIVPAYGS